MPVEPTDWGDSEQVETFQREAREELRLWCEIDGHLTAPRLGWSFSSTPNFCYRCGQEVA